MSAADTLRQAVEALANAKADGKDVVRITQSPIPGVGIGQVTSTYVRQDALRRVLDGNGDE